MTLRKQDMFSTALRSVWGLAGAGKAPRSGRRRLLSFRWHQLFVILGAVLPVLALAGLLLLWGAQEHRDAVERGLSDTAHALATAVDRQIDAWYAALNALATSPALYSGDLKSFYVQASAVARQHNANIVLFDESLRQRINTLTPYGHSLPELPRNPETVRRVFATGKPQVVGPLIGKLARNWIVTVEVPVRRKGQVVYNLNMFFEPAVLSDLLAAQRLPAGWVAVITNAEHEQVARSEDSTRYVGRKAAADFVQAVSGRDEGIVEGRLLAEPRRVIAFQRLSRAPWIVNVAAAEAALAAEERRPLLIFGGLALVAIGMAAGLAWLFSRRVTGPLAALANSAEDVLQGKSTRLKPLVIREFEMLRRALERSGHAAREAITAQAKAAVFEASAERLRKSEEKQRLLARELDHRARNILAVVKSILHLTRADDIDTFVATVEGRIMALAHAHSLLVASRWEGASIGQIIEDELAPYQTHRRRISLSGPNVVLRPAAAQTMALAVHELTTNAVKYGALAVPTGHVYVAWRLIDDAFTLSWRETGGPAVPGPPASGGFGSMVIRNSVEHELGGAVALDWLQEGLHATFSVPKAQLAAAPANHGMEITDAGRGC